MLKLVGILVLITLLILPSIAFINNGFNSNHVLQRQLPLAPYPYTKAPYIWFPILYRYVNIGASQQLIVESNFSSTYILSVFTPTQFDYWVLGGSCDAEYVIPVSTGTYYIPLPKGEYVIAINHAVNINSSEIKLYIGSLDFYSLFYSDRSSVSTGIASYGFYNYSDHLSTYSIKTSAILGYFNISSLQVKGDLASLQMNAVLQINGYEKEELWLQNVILFNTGLHYYSPTDEIWNFSSYLANISISGNGNINTYNSRTYYSYEPSYYSDTPYSVPLAGYLVDNISIVHGKGVYIRFGYIIIQSSNLVPPTVNYYDTVFVKCPEVESANIVVRPNFTGSLNPYDVELVFGGYYPNSEAIFTSLNAKLSLMYDSNDKWVAFPSIMSYGLNSLETAGNIHTEIKNGQAIVKSGNSLQGFLTNKFNPIIPGFTFVNESGKVFYTTSSFTVNISKYIMKENNTLNYTLDDIILNEDGISKVINNGYTIQPNNFWFETISIVPYYSVYDFVTINYPNCTFSGWIRNSTSIVLPKFINISSAERYVLNSSSLVAVVSPMIISPRYVLQYLVSIYYPNKHIQDWFNNGSVVSFPKFINVSSAERYVLNGSSELIIKGPVSFVVPYVLQYYVSLSLPNGTIVGWFNNGTKIILPTIINISPTDRYLINISNIYIIHKSVSFVVPYVLQYYVSLSLPNGTIVGWFNNGTKIILPRIINLTKELFTLKSPLMLIVDKSINYTPIYSLKYLEKIILPNGSIEKYVRDGEYITLPSIIQISNNERYILNSTANILVNSSEIIKPLYITQYLVKINGNTEWVDKGEKITIEIFTTPFFLVRWIGNVHVFNGETVTVNKPIDIRSEETISPLDYLLLAIFLIIIGFIVYTKKFRHR
ncbi:thermopsin family protease [Acidianus manzaensis]|uniref:Thermopsin n=1 Tax=Acidianus manzaensis TaxID=282676 RepID=A0A1W6JX56_9CREN|nr:thermopsin family protease [Acidianus manzaensis]ARM74837.1 hypothetical protein B6F84_01545 [Acidianus manzaensis]